jgi:chromosome partitioning protein
MCFAQRLLRSWRRKRRAHTVTHERRPAADGNQLLTFIVDGVLVIAGTTMNVITMASRKGGTGKSTLTAHLAAFAHRTGHRCTVIDADPQGSLTLWHSLRADGQPPLRCATRGIERELAQAMVDGYEWVFVDTAASMWVVAQEAIRWATLVVIPARPGFFDLNAVRETVAIARQRSKPYAVVLNATPPKRGHREAPAVTHSRAYFDKLTIPVWSGQISQRTGYVLTLANGGSVHEVTPLSVAAIEIASLWLALERYVTAINAARAAPPGAPHGQAA